MGFALAAVCLCLGVEASGELAPFLGGEAKVAPAPLVGDGSGAGLTRNAGDDGPNGRALIQDPDPDKRVRGVRILAAENSYRAARALMHLHEDPHPRVRLKAMEALARITAPAARTWVIEVGLSHKKPAGRLLAARAVGLMKEHAAAPALVNLLGDRSSAVRAAAVVSLGRIGAMGAANEVSRLLRRDGAWEVRAEAAGAMALIRGPSAAADLEVALRDRDPRVRLAILEALEAAAPGAARQQAIAALSDPDWTVRCTASEILTRIGGKEAIGPLIGGLEKAEGRTIRDFSNALDKITGRRLGADSVAWRTWWDANGASWTGPARGGSRGGSPSSQERVTYYDIPIWSERVVFVIDLSQSMQEPSGAGGSRADEARSQLGRALAGLPRSSRVNVIRFRSGAEALSPRPLRPTRGNQAASLQWIRDPRGGTNLHDALEMALRSGGGDTVFLLTDGAPSCGTFVNKTEILESLRRMNRFRKVRIHTIGIGSRLVSDRWGGLLEGLARATDGQCVIRN